MLMIYHLGIQAGELRVQDQYELHSEFRASLYYYVVWSCLRKTNKQTNKNQTHQNIEGLV